MSLNPVRPNLSAHRGLLPDVPGETAAGAAVCPPALKDCVLGHIASIGPANLLTGPRFSQAWVSASEDIASQLTDKISFAERSQENESARVQGFNNKVDDVRKSLQVNQEEMEGAPGAGHSEMDMDDVVRPKSRPKTKHPSASLSAAVRH